MNHFVSDLPNYASAMQGLRHVFIRDLMLSASIGIHPHERKMKQSLCINISVAVEAHNTTKDHKIDDVVCYETLANKVRDLVARGHIDLVETLADDIADQLLTDKRIFIIRVRIEKPDAIADTRSVGVEIERRNTQ